MSDVEWGSDGKEAPKPKRRVPLWAWFCGGGCLLALITVVVAGLMVGSFVQDMRDPDKQWGYLGEVLEIESRPEGEIVGAKVPMTDLRTISIQQGMTKIDFLIAGGKEGEDLRAQLLDPDVKFSMGPLLGNMGRFEPEEIVLNVQGRELRGMRFVTQKREPAPEAPADSGESQDLDQLSPMEAAKLAMRQSTIAVDLSGIKSNKTVIMQYSHMGTIERFDESEVVEFLSHFKLGEQR